MSLLREIESILGPMGLFPNTPGRGEDNWGKKEQVALRKAMRSAKAEKVGGPTRGKS